MTQPAAQTTPTAYDDPRAIADAVRTLAEEAERVDGVAPISEQPLLHLAAAAPGIRHHVVASPEGTAVGYAWVDTAGRAAELVAAPAQRRRGIGTALLAAALRDADRIWAHGFLPPARAFAQAQGLSVARELWRMSREVTEADAVPPTLPEGFTVETFTPAAIDAWLAVNSAAFASHPEQGRITREDVEARMALPWFDPAGFFLLYDDRRTGEGEAARTLAAFHWTKVEEDEGEVYVVGVNPAYQGRGLGHVVTAIGLSHLAERGVSVVHLYVDGDNTSAIATYTRAGFAQTSLDVMLSPAGDATMAQ